jgi:hypothetical protein
MAGNILLKMAAMTICATAGIGASPAYPQSSAAQITVTVAASLRDNWSVRYIAPVPCTGEPAFAILKQTFGDRYIYAGLGTTVLLGPKVTVKAEAGQSNRTAMDEEDLRSYRDAVMRGPLRPLFGGNKRLARAQQ